MMSADPDEHAVAQAIIRYVQERAKREREEAARHKLQQQLKGRK